MYSPVYLTTRVAVLGIAIFSASMCFDAGVSVASAQGPKQIDRVKAAGDSDTEESRPAKLSAKLTKRDVSAAMRKVADWQLKRAEPMFNQDWTYAALYAGFMAVPPDADGQRYQDAMLSMAKKFEWQPGPRIPHADDHAIGQTYLQLYFKDHDPAMIKPIRERMDAVMQLPDHPDKPLWWWCDALFMAPPVLAELYKATGERSYLDFMDREWWITSGKLYSPENHLYFRDASYLGKQESNGKPIFWSRGNGWVMGGLVRVLTYMPQDYPSRDKYVAQFKEMAAEVAALQGEDGLWRPGLLNANAYPLPENSGSAFYTYALAYGINHNLLDRRKYRPVVEKAWKGLVSHIYADGRLGCIQPIGAAPGQYTATSSYVFGVGAYLLAGSEVYQLAR
jgi:rhamnogalacturonyl hydrolase YesR